MARPQSDRVDVAVVGGGPAGSRVAWQLARAGARVRLFDHSHPREKPCGGGVTARALALLADAVPPRDLQGVPVARALFRDGETGPAVVPLDHDADLPPALLVTDRRSFDHTLLRAALEAGVDHVPERVIDIEVTSSGVHLRTPHRDCSAAFVIGADGANSLVRRRCLRPFTRSQLSIATGFFVHGLSSRDIVIEFVADPPGYIWSFPRPDHLAVGICAPATLATTSALRARVTRWIDTHVSPVHRVGSPRLEPYAWPIPSLDPADCRDERPAGDRWALVGDAAGLVDPITREGIHFALLSATLLADALAEDTPVVGGRYLALLRQHVFTELGRAASLARGFFKSGFTALVVEALSGSRRVNRIMRDLVAGEQPYRSLKRRLVATCELGLAWRLLRLELGGRRSRLHADARTSHGNASAPTW